MKNVNSGGCLVYLFFYFVVSVFSMLIALWIDLSNIFRCLDIDGLAYLKHIFWIVIDWFRVSLCWILMGYLRWKITVWNFCDPEILIIPRIFHIDSLTSKESQIPLKMTHILGHRITKNEEEHQTRNPPQLIENQAKKDNLDKFNEQSPLLYITFLSSSKVETSQKFHVVFFVVE
jgi:hypothetical protein